MVEYAFFRVSLTERQRDRETGEAAVNVAIRLLDCFAFPFYLPGHFYFSRTLPMTLFIRYFDYMTGPPPQPNLDKMFRVI